MQCPIDKTEMVTGKLSSTGVTTGSAGPQLATTVVGFISDTYKKMLKSFWEFLWRVEIIFQ